MANWHDIVTTVIRNRGWELDDVRAMALYQRMRGINMDGDNWVQACVDLVTRLEGTNGIFVAHMIVSLRNNK